MTLCLGIYDIQPVNFPYINTSFKSLGLQIGQGISSFSSSGKGPQNEKLLNRFSHYYYTWDFKSVEEFWLTKSSLIKKDLQ